MPNLLLDIPKLDDQDLRYINWWLVPNDWEFKGLSKELISFCDKEKLRQCALDYFKNVVGYSKKGEFGSCTSNTYNKLFGKEDADKNAWPYGKNLKDKQVTSRKPKRHLRKARSVRA